MCLCIQSTGFGVSHLWFLDAENWKIGIADISLYNSLKSKKSCKNPHTLFSASSFTVIKARKQHFSADSLLLRS